MPVVRVFMDGGMDFALVVGEGHRTMVQEDGRMVDLITVGNNNYVFASLPTTMVEQMPGCSGLRGLVLCLIEAGKHPRAVRRFLGVLEYDREFLVQAIVSCPAHLFTNELKGATGVSELDSPWSVTMGQAAGWLKSVENIVQIAKCSGLPWYVRLPLLDCLKEEPEAAMQILRECCDPLAACADGQPYERRQKTVRMFSNMINRGMSPILYNWIRSLDHTRFGELVMVGQMEGRRHFVEWYRAVFQ